MSRQTKLLGMERQHVLSAVRGMNSTDVRCCECGYAYREITQDRTMTRLARRQWIDQGDPNVVHRGVNNADYRRADSA